MARRYVGGHVEIPVDRLLAASRGVPRVLHAVTAEWARGVAIRRVDDQEPGLAASDTSLPDRRVKDRATQQLIRHHAVIVSLLRAKHAERMGEIVDKHHFPDDLRGCHCCRNANEGAMGRRTSRNYGLEGVA